MKTTTRRQGFRTFTGATSAEGLSSEQVNAGLPGFARDAELIFRIQDGYASTADVREALDRRLIVEQHRTRRAIGRHGGWQSYGVTEHVLTELGLDTIALQANRDGTPYSYPLGSWHRSGWFREHGDQERAPTVHAEPCRRRFSGPVSRELATSIVKAEWITRNQADAARKKADEEDRRKRRNAQLLAGLPSLNEVAA